MTHPDCLNPISLAHRLHSRTLVEGPLRPQSTSIGCMSTPSRYFPPLADRVQDAAPTIEHHRGPGAPTRAWVHLCVSPVACTGYRSSELNHRHRFDKDDPVGMMNDVWRIAGESGMQDFLVTRTGDKALWGARHPAKIVCPDPYPGRADAATRRAPDERRRRHWGQSHRDVRYPRRQSAVAACACVQGAVVERC